MSEMLTKSDKSVTLQVGQYFWHGGDDMTFGERLKKARIASGIKHIFCRKSWKDWVKYSWAWLYKLGPQKLFVKSGSVKTENGNLHIVANGGYRRSKYNVDAKIKNEIVFPIIVKDANLEVDNMDVEKYLQAFNNQTVSDKASENVHDAISKSLEKACSVSLIVL